MALSHESNTYSYQNFSFESILLAVTKLACYSRRWSEHLILVCTVYSGLPFWILTVSFAFTRKISLTLNHIIVHNILTCSFQFVYLLYIFKTRNMILCKTLAYPYKMLKVKEGHNSHRIIPFFFSKVNQAIYSSALINSSFKALAQIFISTYLSSTEGSNPDSYNTPKIPRISIDPKKKNSQFWKRVKQKYLQMVKTHTHSHTHSRTFPPKPPKIVKFYPSPSPSQKKIVLAYVAGKVLGDERTNDLKAICPTLRKHAYLNILKILQSKKENFLIKKIWWYDIFYIPAQNIDCGYSLEPPRRGGSNEYPQSKFFYQNKKNNVYPCKPQFYYIKVGFYGSKLYRHVLWWTPSK